MGCHRYRGGRGISHRTGCDVNKERVRGDKDWDLTIKNFLYKIFSKG